MNSKQLLLGGTLILGGGVALFAMTQKNDTPQAISTSEKPAVAKPQDEVARPTVQPLTTDLETERRLLEQKRQEHEARTLEQERQAQALIAEQEKAKANAINKALAEQNATTESQNAPTQTSEPAPLTVKTRPEIIQAQEKPKKPRPKRKKQNKPKLTTNQTIKQNQPNLKKNLNKKKQ